MAGRAQAVRRRDAAPRTGWLADSVIAGFVATGAATIALFIGYLVANAAGVENGDAFTRSMWILTHNDVVSFSKTQPAVALAIHVVAGIAWALIYGAVVAPRAPWGGLRTGLIFSLLPWLLSLFVFLPIVGAGIAGFDLGAGMLPIVGNLIVHLVYGGVLGPLYDRSAEVPDTASGAPEGGMEPAAVLHSEGFAAAGIVGGIIVGALLGVGLATLVRPPAPGTELEGWSIALAVGGALAGGAVGAMVGSFAGLPQAAPDPAELALGRDPFRDNILAFLLPILLVALVAFGIVSVGSILLTTMEATNDKYVPVGVALAGTAIVGFGAWFIASRQSPPSRGDTASPRGH